MPWAYPRGDFFMQNGGPMIGIRRLWPAGASFIATSDYGYALYSPFEKRTIVYSVGLNRFAGMNGDNLGNATQFTNAPASALTSPPSIDYATRAGFLIADSVTPSVFRGSSFDPATCTFAALTEPPTAAASIFSLSNGQTCTINNGLTSNMRVSYDFGVTWPDTISWTINGNSDIDHTGRRPNISPDGSLCAIESVAGVAITRNPAGGPAGVIGVLNTNALIARGAFNQANSVFVFAIAAQPGTIYISTDFNTFAAIPAANNPFTPVNGGAVGSTISVLAYNPILKGWIIISTGSEITVGFLAEDNLNEIVPGIFLDGDDFSGGGPYSTTFDEQGNMLVTGNDLKIINSIYFP